MRHLRRLTIALLSLVFLSSAAMTSAYADSFRYWGYYQYSDGAWGFATVGPADNVPDDGSIEGWRFAVNDDTTSRTPRADVSFEDICPGGGEEEGKQVAVVIDYGTPADAPESAEPPEPRGACANVADDATSADVLAEVAKVRHDDSGMTCGLDDYPANGCSDPVSTPAPTGAESPIELQISDADNVQEEPAASDDDGGSGRTVVLWGAIAAIVLVGVAGLLRWRRSSGESGS